MCLGSDVSHFVGVRHRFFFFFFFFFFNDTATTEIYPLCLHDALPISESGRKAMTSSATSVPAVPGKQTTRTASTRDSSDVAIREERTSFRNIFSGPLLSRIRRRAASGH